MKFKLLIFDFDGTALGGYEPYDRFPPEFAEFLDELSAAGIAWATNTTWGVNEQYSLIRESGVKSQPLFLAGNTGRQLAQIVNGTLLLNAEYSNCIRQQDEEFKAVHWPEIRRIMLRLLNDDLVTRIAFDWYQSQNLFDCSCRTECLGAVAEIVQPLLDNGIYYIFNDEITESFCLLPTHMTKAGVVRKAQALHGITSSATIIAGDGANDLAMMTPELAGGLVCPANSKQCIKAAVQTNSGIVAAREFSWGVTDGVRALLQEVA